MFVCVPERLAQGVCQKGRPAGPSLRPSGGNWGGPKPSSEPSLPAASPPRLGHRRTKPGSLTPSSLPRSRGLSRASQPARFPLDPLPASRRARCVSPPGSRTRGRGSLTATGRTEMCGSNSAPLAPHLVPLRLPDSVPGRRRCRSGISAGKGVWLCVRSRGRRVTVSGKDIKAVESRVP